MAGGDGSSSSSSSNYGQTIRHSEIQVVVHRQRYCCRVIVIVFAAFKTTMSPLPEILYAIPRNPVLAGESKSMQRRQARETILSRCQSRLLTCSMRRTYTRFADASCFFGSLFCSSGKMLSGFLGSPVFQIAFLHPSSPCFVVVVSSSRPPDRTRIRFLTARWYSLSNPQQQQQRRQRRTLKRPRQRLVSQPHTSSRHAAQRRFPDRVDGALCRDGMGESFDREGV